MSITENMETVEGVVDEATTQEPDTEVEAEPEQTAANDGDEDEAFTEGIDYEELMEEDLKELKEEFSELERTSSITQLSNPLRYAALRDLGLSPREAYLATQERRAPMDNRAHLSSAVARRAAMPRSAMSPREMRQARELFSDMTDAEITALYQKVTK
ncbi:MAG: hypothetical protein IJY24_02800 [Clostridia bacterium]|nr:hypothetical protein [Clostridia bacterium]